MWQKRSELLSPLIALTSKNVKYDWKDEHQKCFYAIKRVIGRGVLLAYPDFNAPFEIHTDTSRLQIGAVISQEGKPIAFYSRKMNSAQQNYTTTEKELLSIVATLKEFRNTLLGHQIAVYTYQQEWEPFLFVLLLQLLLKTSILMETSDAFTLLWIFVSEFNKCSEVV